MTVARTLQFLRDDKRGRLLAGGLAGVVLLAALLLAFTGGSTRDASLGMLAFRMAGNTLAVLACLYLVLIGLRRWQTQVASITDRQLGIVETLRLSPKQVLHLVRVGNRQLLLGASDGQVALLAELGSPAQAAADAAPAFISHLQHAAARINQEN